MIRAPIAAPRPVHRWFPTCISVVRDRSGSEIVVRPLSTVHAKEMGTTFTACGESTSNWHKFWGQAFTDFSPNTCDLCAALVAEGTRLQQRRLSD